MPSRWTSATTSPPNDELSPTAICTVPATFSSSNTLPIRLAQGLRPMPSSATFLLASSVSIDDKRDDSLPSISTTRLSFTVSTRGEPSIPNPPMEPSMTITPFALQGATYTSPAGRLVIEPFLWHIPVSAIHSHPETSSVISHPFSVVIRISLA